jgi:hypothetical protein
MYYPRGGAYHCLGATSGVPTLVCNLLVMPSMPAYFEEYSMQPVNPESLFGFRTKTLRQDIVFGLFLVLTVVNVIALFKAIAKWT